jgi:hypothetical protein
MPPFSSLSTPLMLRLSRINGRGAFALAALLLAASLGLGCRERPLGRLLPPHINRVYIPMFDTQAFKSGLEEFATQYTVDEFLKDGRVIPVNYSQSPDLILEGFLTKYVETNQDFSNDDFELFREATITARVYAYAPNDDLRQNPIYVWDGIEATFMYLADPRLTIDLNPDDAKEQLMSVLAAEIVRTVIETEPTAGAATAKEFDKRLEDGGPRYQPVESLRERRYRKRGLPPLRTGF